MELAMGLSLNVAVLAFCWISGWRPVGIRNSNHLHNAQHDDEETNDEEELTALWSNDVETSIGLVVSVAVMVAVAVEIVLETGRRSIDAQ